MASSTTAETAAGEARVPAGSSRSKVEFWLLLAALTAVYITAVSLDSRRFVWFDELFTFDIARAPSLHQLWHDITRLDCQPPLGYLLSRFSMAIFGVSPFGLRLPSMVEFYCGSLALFLYVRGRSGNIFAFLAILLLWASPVFYFATEARPYALVFMAFGCLLLSWDGAVYSGRRAFALFGVAISTLLLLSAHVLGPFSLLPFLAAEAVRFLRRRKPDYPLWAALLLPLPATLVYLPLIQLYSGVVIQPAFRASWSHIAEYFYSSFKFLGPALCLLLLLPASKRPRVPRLNFHPEDLTILGFLLLNPILLNLLMMHTHGGFFDRYCITTTVAICLGIVLALALRLRPGAISLGAVSLMLTAMIAHTVIRTLHAPRVDPIPWTSVRPDLPIVVGQGMTFYEMNHTANARVLDRVYYLKDKEASLRYEQTSFFQNFEGPDVMKAAGFPISGHIEPYGLFVAHHRQFLVFGTEDEYVMRLLHDAGAQSMLITDYSGQTPYENSELYLVTMPPA